MDADIKKRTRSSEKRKPGASFLSCCFTGGPVSDHDTVPEEAAVVRSERRARFRWSRTMKTVPMDDSLAEIEPTAGLPDPKTSPTVKSSKSSSKGAHRQQPAQELPVQLSCCPWQAVAKCAMASQPAPLISVGGDTAKTVTKTTSRSGSRCSMKLKVGSRKSHSTAKGRLDSGIGLLFMTTTLVTLMLYGRACATLVMCTWFYLLPRLRVAAARPLMDSKSNMGSKEMDVNSDEHKKKVILEGLLERRRWRLSTHSLPASARLR